jgi:hypothetical protein
MSQSHFGWQTDHTEEPEWENYSEQIDYVPRAGALPRRKQNNLDFLQQMLVLNEKPRKEERDAMKKARTKKSW